MRPVFLILVHLLVVITALPAGVIAEDPAPVYPGMGGTPLSHLEPIHPAIKNSTEVMGYIEECGVGSWNGIVGNLSYTYVLISPAGSCGKKMVFMEKKGRLQNEPNRIVSVWYLGLNDTFVPDSSDPLEGFYTHYTDAKNNSSVSEFVNHYKPTRWKEEYLSATTRQVYLIGEDTGFYELIVTVDNGTVTGTELIEESWLVIDRDKAIGLVGANSSTTLDDTFIRKWNGEPEWVFSWREGSGVKMAFVPAGGYRSNLPTSDKGTQNVSRFIPMLVVITVTISLIIAHYVKK